jgi:DnaK suppressor protein
LAAERDGAERTVAALSRELGEAMEAAAGAVADDEHDPDGSTTAFERAQTAALLARAREHLVAVE